MADGPIAPPEFIEGVINQGLLDEYESWPKAMKIWPSDLGVALGPEHDGCQRAFWEKCRDAPQQEPSPGVILMFKMGDLAEDYLIKILRRQLPQHGWVVKSVQRRVEAFGISGRLDVEIEHVSTGRTVVIDMKTKRGNAFKFLSEAKPGNVLQVQEYVAATDADEGGLLYADREGQNGVRYFTVPREDERPEKAVEILTQIRDDEEPPPGVGLTIARRHNKGADSVYLNVPWQITWCSLKQCPCKAALPGTPPDTVVAKIKTTASPSVVTLTPAGKKWGAVIMEQLEAVYPDEEFVLED